MRILLTGAAGYIGSVLVEKLLIAGHSVVAVDNYLHNQPCNIFNHLIFKYHDRFKFYDISVTEHWKGMSSLLNRCDVLIPLAALVGEKICRENPQLAIDTNQLAIEWQLNHLSDDQIVIYPNTNSGYGKTIGNELCTEKTPMNPISLYGETKCAAEKYVLQHKNSVVLRLATVFGVSPRMRLDLLVNDLAYKAFIGSPIAIYERKAMRNYVHIHDVCDAFVFCINNYQNMRGEIYNLGHDESNMSKEDLVNVIGEIIPWNDVEYIDNMSDPDQRDYIVSSAKLAKAGFTAKNSVSNGIKELACLYSTFTFDNILYKTMYN